MSRKEVAVKTMKGKDNYYSGNQCTTLFTGYFDQEEVDKFVEESLKMSRFKHAHIMGLIAVCLDAGSAPYIIMPYMANGSLLKYLKKERKKMKMRSFIVIFMGNIIVWVMPPASFHSGSSVYTLTCFPPLLWVQDCDAYKLVYFKVVFFSDYLINLASRPEIADR